MKTNKKFSHGITGLFLLLILVLAGCQNPISELTETGPRLPGPANLKATKLTGGVLLSWELVPDAAGYQVYRYNPATGEEKALQGSYKPAHYYLDLVDFDNPLTPLGADGRPITYTYKVVAVSEGSGNSRAALDELVFNGTSSINVVFEAADIPARTAATPWIKLDQPTVVELRDDEDSRRLVVENTTPNLKYDAKHVVDDYVFVYDDRWETAQKEAASATPGDTNPFNPTKTLDIPVFAGSNTLEVTASYARGEYYPGTDTKTVQISVPEEEILTLGTSINFDAWFPDSSDPVYAEFGWDTYYLATGYSIYKVKGYYNNNGKYYIQGDWAKITLKNTAQNGSWWSATEAAASEPGAYLYALVVEAGTKRSLPIIEAPQTHGTVIGDPEDFSVTLNGLDEQYVLIEWKNNPHVETYTVYKAVADRDTFKIGDWTEVSLSDKKLNTEKGTWTAAEKGLPKIDAIYIYKLVAASGTQRTEALGYEDSFGDWHYYVVETHRPGDGSLSARSLIDQGYPLTVQLTLHELDSEVTYKLSRAEATWAEGETDFSVGKAVSIGAFTAPVTITLPRYHTGDTYTFSDTITPALQVRKSYIYKLVTEKSGTEQSEPAYTSLHEGAYSRASYLNVRRDTDYDGAAFTITDAGTYWGDGPALRISRAPENGQYVTLTTRPASTFASYGDHYFFDDAREELSNYSRYHYKFEVVLNGAVLEEKDFSNDDVDGDGNTDGATMYATDSTLYTPNNPVVTAYFASGWSPSSAAISSIEKGVDSVGNALITGNWKIRLSGSSRYVINAPVTVTYTAYDSNGGIIDGSGTSPATVAADKTITFTPYNINPNATYNTFEVRRTTGSVEDFNSPQTVTHQISFYVTQGTPYNSIALSLIPGTNIPWRGTEQIVSVQRRRSTETGYTTVTTGLALTPPPLTGTSADLNTVRTGLDNASSGLVKGNQYYYRVNISGGYFGTRTYTYETSSSASPNTYGNLGTPTIHVTGNTVWLDFNGGYNYENAKILVQYNSAYYWSTTQELTLDTDGTTTTLSIPGAGNYDLQYKYKNDNTYASTTFTVP
jgi:hypothetical protein